MIIRRNLDLDEIITQLGINQESFEKWKANENLSPQSKLIQPPSIQPLLNLQIPYSEGIRPYHSGGHSARSKHSGQYEE